MANCEKFNQTIQLFQLYSCSWDAIVVVELEIFESLEINICLLKHLETNYIRQKSPTHTMRYMLGKSTALKGLVPCYPFVLSVCKQSISVASLYSPSKANFGAL